ncbi:MAG TPA: fibronectin type III domain-containing protein [Gaiellaceae bacterium]|nr:fibronectin type III domain-containing protein [Gaiellaceae bacterium]
MRHEHGALVTRSGDLRIRFDRTGTTVSAPGGAVSFGLAGVGRSGSAARPLSPTPRLSGSRVVYRRGGGVVEWYRNGPLGLEQGFTVARKPSGAAGPLVVSLTLQGGLHARAHGGAVAFVDRSGRTVLRYGQLVAEDARGRRLESSLRLEGSRLLLRIADTNAQYPVRIDPFVQQGAKLTPLAGTQAAHAFFGLSVSLSSDGIIALVGGYGDGLGAAWAFHRSSAGWVQEGPKLTPSDQDAQGGNGYFGYSVALSGDGSTALIGGPADGGFAGAAWVFTNSRGTWSQQGSKLTPTGESGNAWFGASTALSDDGNTAIVGGPYDASGSGAAWVFTRSGSAWAQQGLKLASGLDAGWSVSLAADGNTALVGAPDLGGAAGSATVFTRSSSTWGFQQALVPSDADNVNGGGQLGYGVALSADGKTAIVGAPLDGHSAPSGRGPGAAWIFARSGSTWAQQGSKLTAADANNANGSAEFGGSVALSSNGNAALVGGPDDEAPTGAETGSAWLFTRSGTTWSVQGSAFRGDDLAGSSLGSSFGTSVSLSADGTIALVGGQFDHDFAGAAWVMDLGDNGWTQEGPKLVPFDTGAFGVGLGFSAAISADGDTALIGAPKDGSDATEAGSAWVFVRSAGTWSPQESFTGQASFGGFGWSVALSADGNTALMGSPGDNGDAGRAWVFTRTGTTWSPATQLIETGADNSGSGGAGEFGTSVALSADGNTALVSAAFDGAENQGAAWVFTRSGSAWTQQGAKLTGTGADSTGGSPSFGSTVALSSDGNTALIAGQYDGANDQGAVWVFSRSGSTWAQQGSKLTGGGEDESGGGGEFGFALALSGDGSTAAIGAPFDSSANNGAVWVFTRTGSTWAQQGPKLTVAATGALSGAALALSSDGNSLIVGSPAAAGPSGVAWLFSRSGTAWTQQGEDFAADDADPRGGNQFGTSVAASADAGTIVVGGPGDGDTGAGAAFVFTAPAPAAPTGVTAVPGNSQGTVSFKAPVGPVTSYTVTSTPGGTVAAGSGSPIVVGGLTNGVSYTFRVTASNGAGTGPPSAASAPVTPAVPSSGGGGGGGGGGSSTVSVTVGPKTQSLSSGGTATFTVTVTNSGGAYVSAAAVSDPAAPGCSRTGNDIADLAFFAPGETLSWSCSVGGVGAGFTNTVTASAVTAPGPVVTATDSAEVTVNAPAAVPLTPPATIPTVIKPPVPTRTTNASRGVTRIGNAKANTLIGTARNDTLNGEGGNDTLNGKGGTDTLIGGPGNDVITGGPGNDTINGGPGNDTIHANDGQHDTINCGTGKDTVYADKHDTINKNCEIVHRA